MSRAKNRRRTDESKRRSAWKRALGVVREHLKHARDGLLRRSTITVLAIVLLGNVIVESESVHLYFPALIVGELRFHVLMSRFESQSERVNQIAVVDVDDDSFWNAPVFGRQPISTRYVADLAMAAADSGATVIATDFPAFAHFENTQSAVSPEDLDYLRKAVVRIHSLGIPIVAGRDVVERDHRYRLGPAYLPSSAIPEGMTVGHLHIPEDPRQIPLRIRLDESSASIRDIGSFAMGIVAGYDTRNHIMPTTLDEPLLKRAIAKGKFVYGAFLPISGFWRISARDLFNGSADAKAACRGRIVIIGPTWHAFGPGRGPRFEEMLSPVGEVPALYLHANYVAALLDGHYRAPIPIGIALAIEFAIGLVIYGVYHALDGTSFALAMAGLALGLAMAAYVMFSNSGWYLDFVPLLAACFIHVAWEHFHSYHHLARRAGAPGR
ncbi:MAG TPA: CHASE2 domain-containing protein [Candidatus Binataceae bacterium]|nr:CHASE2 domain-containing protein [Candidatus Binataceae bacterium]